MQATDYESGPNAAESPYFSGGGSNRRASGGYKRKRATRGAGGDKKLVKKGKWYSKSKATKEKRSSSSTKSTTASSFQRSSTGSSFNKSATPYKSAAASTSKGSGGLLAPPRSRTVKKDWILFPFCSNHFKLEEFISCSRQPTFPFYIFWFVYFSSWTPDGTILCFVCVCKKKMSQIHDF